MAEQAVPGALEAGVMRSLLALFLISAASPQQLPVFHVTAGDSIQHVIDAAPSGAVIDVAPGIYREVLEISKSGIILRGVDTDSRKTVIVFDKSAGTAGGTTKSATVNVRADDFLAENLTLVNDWNRTHGQSQQGSQALALLVTGDRAIFRNVRLLGNQDTLYAANPNARQYFDRCYIEGNVDFIFGDSRALFDDCEIHSTAHPNGGYLTAHSRNDVAQEGAYVFDHCKLTAEPGQKRVYLGRPWRPYARVIFLNCEIGEHIEPAGWREWHPGETHLLETAYYAEYQSSGPGAHAAERDGHSHQLTSAEAAQYQVETFFGGWRPDATGKPR